MSYYSSTVTVNAEGDSVLRNETVQGLGSSMFLTILFGSIIRLATPPRRRQSLNKAPRNDTESVGISEDSVARDPISQSSSTLDPPNEFPHLGNLMQKPPSTSGLQPQELNASDFDISKTVKKNSSLTVLIIDPGYFAAGGIAGAVSRTATAPLDRLKVYLIANTGVAKDSLEAVKQGQGVKAVKHVGRPLIEACQELWRAGGIRSLFAGMMYQ
jgi:solute carrier family 25 (mitochondrial phosphate transporter), member 23/24/25/41